MEAIKMILFSLLVIGFFTWFSNYIPQIESHPPKKISLDAALSTDEMIEGGERVFNTKGTCGICHAIGRVGNRGPDLGGVAANASSRKPGMAAVDYLLESLIKPAAYLVEGYGPLMPPMGAILTPGELMVTVAYLQSLGGEVSITPDMVRAALGNAGAAVAPAAPSAAAAPATGAAGTVGTADTAEAGEKVFKEICAACHGTNPALDGPIGPSIKGSVAALIEAKVLKGTYPAGYMPKRGTKLMPPMPHLKDQIGGLAKFLGQ